MNYKKQYDEISEATSMSARKYFLILGLALYTVKNVYARTSTEIVKNISEDDDEVFRMAVKIAKVAK